MTIVYEGTVSVAYSQFYLGDGSEEYTPGCVVDSTARIAGAEPGGAFLVTGIQDGLVGMTVVIAETDPGPDLGGFEDVVEIDFEALGHEAAIEEWEPGEPIMLGKLPAGPGRYRLRYHARGMDAARLQMIALSEDEIVDHYLIQLWPAAAPSPAKVLKQTSATARF